MQISPDRKSIANKKLGLQCNHMLLLTEFFLGIYDIIPLLSKADYGGQPKNRHINMTQLSVVDIVGVVPVAAGTKSAMP